LVIEQTLYSVCESTRRFQYQYAFSFSYEHLVRNVISKKFNHAHYLGSRGG
jgi:hypothetical protein